MSSNQSTSSTTYTSFTSSTSSGGENYSKSETVRSSYNDVDGHRSERITSETGKPTVVETSEGPSRQVLTGASQTSQGRITDVTDEDADAGRRYEEAMEDEYAKREGGA